MFSPFLIYFEVERAKRELLRKSSNIAGYKVFMGTDSEYLRIHFDQVNKRKSDYSSVFTETRRSKSDLTLAEEE